MRLVPLGLSASEGQAVEGRSERVRIVERLPTIAALDLAGLN
jgi:hypothetical protein